MTNGSSIKELVEERNALHQRADDLRKESKRLQEKFEDAKRENDQLDNEIERLSLLIERLIDEEEAEENPPF